MPVPPFDRAAFRQWVNPVCQRVADSGFGGVEPEVAHLVKLARGYGVAPTSADIVADRSAPGVARARALGRVVAEVAAVVAADHDAGSPPATRAS